MLDFTILILILMIYFMPTIVAYQNDHKNKQAIGTANFFFGWTIIGWLICLIWAQCK